MIYSTKCFVLRLHTMKSSNAASRRTELRFVQCLVQCTRSMLSFFRFDSCDLRSYPVEISCDGKYKHLGAAVKLSNRLRTQNLTLSPSSNFMPEKWKLISGHAAHVKTIPSSRFFWLFYRKTDPVLSTTFWATFCFPYLLHNTDSGHRIRGHLVELTPIVHWSMLE